jgi:hypothetical protein
MGTMFKQSPAEKDSTAGVTPTIRSRMPWRVTHVEAQAGFKLRIRFMDGLEGTVDLAALVRSDNAGVFACLPIPPFLTRFMSTTAR